jgi:type 1 glutamine amidotransferase
MNQSLRFLLVAALAIGPALSALAADAKRVIVVTVTTGFRHSSIPYAEKTIQKLGEESGAFTVVDFARQPDVTVPKKPNKPKDLPADADDKLKAAYETVMQKYNAELAKWTPEYEAKAKELQAQFDAAAKQSLDKLSPANLVANKIDMVIFANTTGDLPLPDRDGFIQWIEDGHSFAAMHSGSDTFHGFPGYIQMLGGEFETHHAQVPADLVAADTAHPANAGLGSKWDLSQEEMYHIKNQDRSRVHILWYMQHDPNETATQVFFPVSWCRMAGKGRVFYTSLGHREDLWSDDPNLPGRKNSPEISKQYQAHILGGIKWALGLADGDATPNPSVK